MPTKLTYKVSKKAFNLLSILTLFLLQILSFVFFLVILATNVGEGRQAGYLLGWLTAIILAIICIVLQNRINVEVNFDKEKVSIDKAGLLLQKQNVKILTTEIEQIAYFHGYRGSRTIVIYTKNGKSFLLPSNLSISELKAAKIMADLKKYVRLNNLKFKINTQKLYTNPPNLIKQQFLQSLQVILLIFMYLFLPVFFSKFFGS